MVVFDARPTCRGGSDWIARLQRTKFVGNGLAGTQVICCKRPPITPPAALPPPVTSKSRFYATPRTRSVPSNLDHRFTRIKYTPQIYADKYRFDFHPSAP